MTPLPPAAQFALRRFGILLAACVFAADQVTKWLVSGPLDLEAVDQIYLLPFFNLTWTQNYGISFGMMTAASEMQRWMLVGLTLLVASAVALWLWRERARGDVIALGLVLGGALGNIVDRVRVGYVVDFADLHFGDFRPFLIFNVADAAITIGVLLLVARALLVRDKAV
ncbi:MAG: signal peptidase II [Pseudomonadota bacterium]